MVFESGMAARDSTEILQPSIPIHLTFLFLGLARDCPRTNIGGLNLLYGRGIGKEERAERLWEEHKIRLNALLGKEEDIMSIAESFLYQGREEGRIEGKNEMTEYMIDAFARTIANFARDNGITVGEAMSRLNPPEEYADAIGAKANALISNQS